MRIIPLAADRTDEVLALLNSALGPRPLRPRDAAYWRWKHEENPFGRSLVFVAEWDGRIVGVRALLRWQLVQGTAHIEAARPVDTVTHADYRRRGIFRRLTEQAIEEARRQGIQWLFNTPNRHSLPGYLKLGWRSAGRLPLFVRFTRPLTALKSLLRRSSRTDDRTVLDAWHCDGLCPIDGLFRDRPAVEQLLQTDQQRVTAGIRTVRTFEFLRWRYEAHPHAQYVAALRKRNGRLEAAVIARRGLRRGLRELMVDECLWRDDADAAVAALRELADQGEADVLWASWPRGSATAAVLARAGFRRLPASGIRLVARSVGRTEPTYSSSEPIGPWALHLGDVEGL